MRHKPTGWFSEKEAAQVSPADKVFESPIPTQIVSNGEYNPLPQTEKQKQVEGLIKEYADCITEGGGKVGKVGWTAKAVERHCIDPFG